MGEPLPNTTSASQHWLAQRSELMALTSTSWFVRFWASSGVECRSDLIKVMACLVLSLYRLPLCRQLYFTGQFISVILRCIFSGWSKIPNGIPVSQGITTQEMVGFFLAFLVTLPFMFIHTSKITPRKLDLQLYAHCITTELTYRFCEQSSLSSPLSCP